MQSSNGIGQVTAWLLAKRPELEEIDWDMDLIENRVIDSLGFMDFVFFLEELTGRELDTDARSVNSFRTLRAIQSDILQMRGDGGQVGI
jgi:acyl carrier protein